MKWVDEIEHKTGANSQYCDGFQFEAHDKVKLIGQTSALLMCLKERCNDIDDLVKAVRVLEESLKFVCGDRCAKGLNPCVALDALDEVEKLR